MTCGYMLLALQQDGDRVLNENLVTAASIALIVASAMWMILSRLILRNLRRSAHVAARRRRKIKDLWKEPPR